MTDVVLTARDWTIGGTRQVKRYELVDKMSAHQLTQRHPPLCGSVHCTVAWPLRSHFEKHYMYSKQLRSLSRRSRHHTCDEAYPR